MTSMEGALSFGAPQWFWALSVVPVLVALWIWNERRARALLGKLVAHRLMNRLAGGVSWGKRRSRFALFLLGFALAVVALAQPRFGYTWEEAKQRGRDILIAVDVSKSMLATDITPNRLERAKLAIQDLIAGLKGDRVGLIAFAGTAFLQAPLTIDDIAVRNALSELDTEIIPQGGSNIAEAIRTACEAFGKGESEHRALIILTDGEELDANAQAAAEAVRDEMRIFTVGIGTQQGSLIPLPGGRGEFVKDADGNFVKSRLDEERLRNVAEATSGWYIHLQQGRPEMLRLIRDGIASMGTQENDTRMSRRPIERYHWPLSASLVMLVASMLVGERRQPAAPRRAASLRTASSVLALLILFGAGTIQAAPRNPGVAAYEREEYAAALEQFARQADKQPGSAALQFNLGSAAYKNRDYDTALEAFSKAATSSDPGLRAKAAYNLGNTLFQRGVALEKKEAKLAELRNALAQYDGSLAINPADENAQYNREVVRKLIEALEQEQKQEQQQQQQDQKNQDDQKQDQQDQQQDGQGDSKDQQQQGGDQQKKGDQGSNQQQKQGGDQSEQKGQQGDDRQPQDGQGQPDDANKEGEGKESDSQQPGGDKQQPAPPNQNQGKDPGKMPVQPEEKKPTDGQLKAAQPGQTGDKPEGKGQEAASASAQAVPPGTMTPEEARALLESLRTEDQRVRLLQPDARKLPQRMIRDW